MRIILCYTHTHTHTHIYIYIYIYIILNRNIINIYNNIINITNKKIKLLLLFCLIYLVSEQNLCFLLWNNHSD